MRPIALSRFVSSNSSSTMPAQRAPVAEELLEGPRQAAVAVREVRAKRLLEGGGRAFVDLLGLADHPLELGPDGIDVDRHPGILERDQADAQRALDERAPIPRRALPQERGEGRVRQGQALDDDPVAFERGPIGWSGTMLAASMPRTLGPTHDI